jgi:hypothetical protein
MLNYLKAQPQTIPRLLKHVWSSETMELLLKIVSVEDQVYGYKVIEWLKSQNLVQKLLAQLDIKYEDEVQSVASQALVDLIAHIYEFSKNITNFNASLIVDMKR